jgi:hypothetical protein
VAEEAQRRLLSLAAEAERRMRSVADDAARTLQPFIGQAAQALRTLRTGIQGNLPPWPWRVIGAGAGLRSRVAARAARRWPEPSGPSPEDGVRRLSRVANALALAGAIDTAVADSILDSLDTALLARGRLDSHALAMRDMRWRHRAQTTQAPAGTYRAVPVGITLPADPDTGSGETRLFTLVITPDRGLLTAAGRVVDQPADSSYAGPTPLPSGFSNLSASDDRGNRYLLHQASWSSDGDTWSGMLEISPVPAAGIGWLEITGLGSAAVPVDLAHAYGDGGHGPSGPAEEASPIGRLLDAKAQTLLYIAAEGFDAGRQDLSDTADIVAALAATGALAPAQPAVDRLVTLARRLGVEVPPELGDVARPAGLPEAWVSVLDNRYRRDGRRGSATAAAVLPELDGTRFVLAGLQSDTGFAELYVLGWGPQPWSDPFTGRENRRRLSWLARDNAGRWHVAEQGSGSYSDDHAEMQLRLRPPLHPDATELEVIMAGPAGQVSATVPLDWLEPAGADGREPT